MIIIFIVLSYISKSRMIHVVQNVRAFYMRLLFEEFIPRFGYRFGVYYSLLTRRETLNDSTENK